MPTNHTDFPYDDEHTDYRDRGVPTIEDSGGSVSYYKVAVANPFHIDPYEAECGDIVEALEMTPNESNIFKEIWRRAAARQGREKLGHSSLRGAEKLVYFANRILHQEKK